MPALPDEPTRRLRDHGLRVTTQRRAILGAFAGGRTEHLTADDVLRRARSSQPAVSRATVYGTLAEFQRAGVLGAYGRPELVRYESNVSDHEHFWCERCERLYDIELETLDTDALESEGFVCERAHVLLEGTCPACVAFVEGMHAGASAVRRRRSERAPEACVVVPSPVGALFATASKRGVTRVAFEGQVDADGLSPASGPGDDVLSALGHQLAAYFAGARDPLDVPVDPDALARPATTVLDAVRTVPYGEVVAYTDLIEGTDEDEVSRAVGTAVGGNPIPILIPCHRVLRGAGELVDYSGGVHRKRALLALEGARV
jgi:methylated-DNA-[protein]-cysteine S-methyltransferase